MTILPMERWPVLLEATSMLIYLQSTIPAHQRQIYTYKSLNRDIENQDAGNRDEGMGLKESGKFPRLAIPHLHHTTPGFSPTADAGSERHGLPPTQGWSHLMLEHLICKYLTFRNGAWGRSPIYISIISLRCGSLVVTNGSAPCNHAAILQKMSWLGSCSATHMICLRRNQEVRLSTLVLDPA
jgi:hypothetical protein